MDDLISKLSEIRSEYNCFDEAERQYYHALSEEIRELSGRVDGDTIYRQAAIDAVDVGAELLRRVLDEADIVGVERGTFKWELELIEACISDMKELPSAQQWIPVTERLPEEDGNYLVTYEKGYAEDYGFNSIGIAPFEVDCEGFGIWQEEFDRYTLGSLGSDWVEIKVIAWMLLPEPYTER